MSGPAYYVIEVDIHDPEGMKPYQAGVGRTLLAHGGEIVVAGGLAEPVEGEAPKGRIVIVRFPDLATAHAWHNSVAYQALLVHRLASADGRSYFVEGV